MAIIFFAWKLTVRIIIVILSIIFQEASQLPQSQILRQAYQTVRHHLLKDQEIRTQSLNIESRIKLVYDDIFYILT